MSEVAVPVRDGLDESLTFGSLVIGPGNRLAAAAARRVADQPGIAYNPLVLVGPPGLGKTHLLHAIATHTRQLRGQIAIQYLPTGELVDGVSAAVAADRLAEIRASLSGADLLLLDDLQFLAGRDRTQEELLRVWDPLLARRVQVVLASDRPLAELSGVDPRLISRFGSGLALDLSAPDRDTVREILDRRLRTHHDRLAPPVLDRLAELPWENVRELHGALNRLLATQEMEGRTLAPERVTEVLGIQPEQGIFGNEFHAFLSDISSTVAEVVETEPWRRTVAEAILRWEAEGIRTGRLERMLDADSAPDVDTLVRAFTADAERLVAIRAELERYGPALTANPALRDPDQVLEAERVLAQARGRQSVAAVAAAAGAGAPDARANGAGAEQPDAAPRVDRWFLDREKVAWEWLAIGDRLLEELG